MMRFRRTPWDSKNPTDPSKKPRRALSVRPDLGGAAAGLAAAMRMAGGAIIASIAGLFLADSIHAWPVGFFELSMVIVGSLEKIRHVYWKRQGLNQPMTCTKEKPLARVTKKEYEMLAAFRYRLRHFLRFSESAAEASGLTSRQYQALLAIRGFPARECVTIGDLAEQLQIAHHSAVGLVDRLVVQNLVSREAGTQDRRHVYVKPLPADWRFSTS